MIAALILTLAADAPRKPASPPPPPASIDGLPVGGIAQQQLPSKGCAAYLFSTGETKTLVAMAVADPAMLRIALDGATLDYARSAQTGAASYGLAASTEYRRGETVLTLDLTVSTRGGVTAGALVSQATLRIDRAGQDTIVMPIAGMIGCA